MIVEATAGNTGIGLALVANARGYRTVIVIPQTQSQEKKDMLRQCGATLYEVPALPYRDPNHYVHVAGRLAEVLARTEPNGAIWAQQFDNVANRQGHQETTGPEIWAQTQGKSRRLHLLRGHGRHARRCRRGAARAERAREDRARRPARRGALQLLHTGELKMEGTSITEGIGQGRITRNLEGLQIDFACQVPDTETVEMVFDLLQHEGLVLGSSSGINVAGAVRLARELGPGHVIVTALCDSGSRYASRLFNPEFLRAKQLPVPEWLESASAELPPGVVVR